MNHLIQPLNKLKTVSQITLQTLNQFNLTEEEENLIKTHRPEQTLVVYGTLAPGKPNHHIVEHIQGTWQKGIIKGELSNKGWAAENGYLGFCHTSPTNEKSIEAHILTSTELPQNWSMLDDFEGEGYQRILTTYQLEDGTKGIGFIYAVV
jgi:gamma-glutamylcyclotransferase (GGCT)/AIG2-like uncharacterized protein YtfP